MALIKTSAEILSIQGRLGGVYFKTGKDGMHCQAMPRVVKYVRSPAQQGKWELDSPFLGFGIDGHSGAAALWLLALLAFYAATWAGYALTYLFSEEGQREKRITGYNWYIHYALKFPECEAPPFWKPPRAPNDRPDFLVTYEGMWIYHHAPGEWPADCPADYYWPGLFWNGKRSFRTDNLIWYLWWKDTRWVLSQGLDFEDPNTTFYSSGADIIDYYRNPITLKWIHVYFGSPESRQNPP